MQMKCAVGVGAQSVVGVGVAVVCVVGVGVGVVVFDVVGAESCCRC